VRPLERVAHRRRQRGGEREIVRGELAGRAALQHQHADRLPGLHDRQREERREALLAEALHRLPAGILRPDGARHRALALGDEPGDALAQLQAHVADGRGGEADVAAHDQHVGVGVGIGLAHVDADHLDLHDRRDLGAQLGEQLGDGFGAPAEVDDTQDAVEARVAALVDAHADAAAAPRLGRHAGSITQPRFAGVSLVVPRGASV
jgi:hypothetical protein